jgi:hypothetical protein
MAFNKQPDTWITTWTEDGTTISVDIADFPELTAAEADSGTGDIRKIVFAICKKFYDEYSSRSSTNQPSKWTSSLQTSANATTGEVTHVFSNTFKTEILTQEVADET